MSSFVWEDPPPGSTPRQYHYHDNIARKLRTRKRAWAWVATSPSKQGARYIAVLIRGGRHAAYEPAGDYDAVVRLVEGENRIYARWLGDGFDDD